MTRGRPTGTVGLLLAAGAGRRFGGPKALAGDAGAPWVVRTVETLRTGGCDRVVVVVGAAADRVTDVLADKVAPDDVVLATDWADGMGASLRSGLGHLRRSDVGDVALVHLVDLPSVGPDVVARMVEVAAAEEPTRRAALLARATYDGRPGHPVLLGRDHWAAAAAVSHGDRGARDLLASDRTLLVDCGDLSHGLDQDRPTPATPPRDRPPPGRPTQDQRPAT